jgi:hypothetical protein
MDLLLALAEDCVIDLVLTDRLLDEWDRVIVREQHRTPEAAKKIAYLIRTGFPESVVPERAYQPRLEELDGPDPDDLHHIADAIHARADTAQALAPHGISVSPPDPYLCALLERYPNQNLRTVTRMAAEK